MADRFCLLQKNKFLDPITPSMRKVDSGGEKPGKKENNAGNSVH